MSSESTGAQSPPPFQAEQFYLTHCSQEDDVRKRGGYSIRACSTTEDGLLTFVNSFPSYQLPVELLSQAPLPEEAPQRLARVKLESGQWAMVHSSYLPQDTKGRRGNYCTHVLVCSTSSTITLLQSTQAWGATQWCRSYAPGSPQKLAVSHSLPQGTEVNDDALTTFLSDNYASCTHGSLATTTCPERLASSGEIRKDWICWALQGALTLLSRPNEQRKRLFVHAEPGIVALMVYAIARLLPAKFVDGITYSTYENLKGAFTTYRFGQIVGTYTGTRDRGLERDHLERLGYGIDTFKEVVSDELRQSCPDWVREMVKAVARSDWTLIQNVHELWKMSPRLTLENLGDALKLRPCYERVKQSNPTGPDLHELRRSDVGQVILSRYEAKVWPKLSGECRRDKALRQAYSEVLTRRLKDLEGQLADLLQMGESDWRGCWDLIYEIVPEQEREERLTKAITAARRATESWKPAFELRLALLETWHPLVSSDPIPPLPPEHTDLLYCEDDKGLGQLVATSSLPIPWKAQAILLCAKQKRFAKAIQIIFRRKDDPKDHLLSEVCLQIKDLNVESRGDLVHAFFQTEGDDSIRRDLFDRLRGCRLRLSKKELIRLLELLKGFEGDIWFKYWAVAKNLRFLTEYLTFDYPQVRQLWDRYIKLIGEDCLEGDSTRSAKLLKELQKTKVHVVDQLPDDLFFERLEQWEHLKKHIEDPPKKIPPLVTQALTQAQQQLEISSIPSLLERRYAEALHRDEPQPEELEKLAQVTRGFFPEDEELFVALIAMVSELPEEQRSLYEDAFLDCIPRRSRASLVIKFKPSLSLNNDQIARHAPEASAGINWKRFAIYVLIYLLGVVTGILIENLRR